MFLTNKKVLTLIIFILSFSSTLFATPDFSNQKLVHSDMSHQDLKGAIFNGTKLNGVDLSYANLQGAIFENAKLTNVKFIDTNLANAKFINCKMTNVNIKYACLAYAKFMNNKMTIVQMDKATLIGTKFSNNKMTIVSKKGAIYDGIPKCAKGLKIDPAPQKIMTSAVHIKSNKISKIENKPASANSIKQEQSKLSESTVNNQIVPDFTNKRLVQTDMSHQDLKGAKFIGANLSNVDLSYTNLQGAIFKDTRIVQSKFIDTNLAGAKFINCEIIQNKMNYACLAYAEFNGNEMKQNYMDKAILIGTKFSNNDSSQNSKKGAIYDGIPKCARGLKNEPVIQKPITRATVIKSEEISKALSDTDNGKIDLTINFKFDSDKIKGSAHTQIFEIAQALKSSKLANTKIQIQGHTDSRGEQDYNMDLSYRRAISVMRELNDKYSFNSSRFSVQGYGESQPVSSNINEVGRALNRRVTLVNISH